MAARLSSGLRLDGSKFGHCPTTPKKMAPTIVKAEANHALIANRATPALLKQPLKNGFAPELFSRDHKRNLWRGCW